MMRTTTPILSILIAVALFVFFTHPEYLETADIKEEIGQYQDAKEKYAEFSSKLEGKIQKKNALTAQESEGLVRLVPDTIDETQHLVDLETMAERHNMLFGNTSVESRDFAPASRGGGQEKSAVSGELTSVDISFELVGTYAQFKSFLADLERSITIFEVTRMSFDVVEGPFQQFGLTVRTYALPNPNE